MVNLAQSALQQRYAFVPFTTSRPRRRTSAGQYGYGTIFTGGLRRLVVVVAVTLWHMAIYPFVLVLRQPSVVQVQASDFQAFWEAAYYAGMAKRFRIPVSFRLGGSFDHFYDSSSEWVRRMIRAVLRWPGLVVVQSENWRRYLSGLGRKNAVAVLPNAIADSLPGPRREYRESSPACLFIAGPEAEWKGMEEVIVAMAALKQRGIDVRFRLVAILPHLQARILEQGFGDFAQIEGILTHDRMLDAMRSCDIFLMPSHGEGFPNSLIEAMACGQACIVTAVGAIPEIVDDGGALVIPVGDGQALATAIETLICSPAKLRELGERGRQIVQARYTQSTVLPILDRAWQELLSSSAVGRPIAK